MGKEMIKLCPICLMQKQVINNLTSIV